MDTADVDLIAFHEFRKMGLANRHTATDAKEFQFAGLTQRDNGATADAKKFCGFRIAETLQVGRIWCRHRTTPIEA